MPWLALWFTPAAWSAERLPVSASLAVEDNWNHSVMRTPQLAVGASVWVRSWAAVELHGSRGLTRRSSTWVPLLGPYPDASTFAASADIRSKLSLEAHVLPFHGTLGEWDSDLGIFLGAGLLWSETSRHIDLGPDFQAEERSTLTRMGLEGNAWKGHFGLRLQLAATRYDESVDRHISNRTHLWVGLGLQCRSTLDA